MLCLIISQSSICTYFKPIQIIRYIWIYQFSPCLLHVITTSIILSGRRCGTRTPLQVPKTRVLPLHYILYVDVCPSVNRLSDLPYERNLEGMPAQLPLGTGYRTWTDTVSLPRDFKSLASTYFANPAYLVVPLRLERRTTRLWAEGSNQLNYGTIWWLVWDSNPRPTP